VTLGYKGRLLCDVRLWQPVSHTAGPGLAACEVAVDYWNRVKQRAAAINRNRPRAFDQVLPSLRSFHSHSDGLSETAELLLAFRLPPDVPPEALAALLEEMADPVELSFRGGEAAYLADKNNALVRAFLAAIRAQGEQPGFVVKTGTSDMNVVGPVWQCPIVAFGPGDSSLDHTPDEHVAIAEWVQGTTVLAGVLDRIMAG
jgi:LysW-gamma-L-lysine carboxypeptidase